MVNRWISKAEGQALLRYAAQRFVPAAMEDESAIQAISDRKRLRRMMDRIFEATATGWPGLLATA